MAIHTQRSGLIQTVQPGLEIESYQHLDAGETQSENLQDAVKDPDSPNAIPDIPTTEAPYDGQVAFGLFIVDESLDGDAT